MIDHDPSGAERIQRPLTDAGYDVVVRSDAAGAMSTFEEVRPDLAVIEALLPEKSGPVLCQEIKDSPAGRATPVVLLLESDEDKQARARSLDLHGCDLLIERSIDEDELIELLEQLLRARMAQVDTVDETPPEKATQEPEQPAAVATDDAEAAAESGRDASGKLIDSNGVVDALSRLDAIIDEQTDPDHVEATTNSLEGPERSIDPEKLKKAERAGDFSFLSEEREKVDEKSPSSPADDADEADPSNPDTGQDIADHIDALFSANAPGEPTPAEKQVLSWTFENAADAKKAESSVPTPAAAEEEDPAQRVTTPTPAPPAQKSGPVECTDASILEPTAVEPSFEVVPRPEKGPEQKVAEAKAPAGDTSAAAMQTATFSSSVPRPTAEPPTERKHRWWVVAACLSVVLIGGGLAILFLGGGADESPAVTTAGPARPSTASTVANARPAALEESAELPAAGETTEGAEAIDPAGQPGAAQSASEPAPSPATSPGSPPARAAAAKPPARELPKTTKQAQTPAAPTARPGSATAQAALPKTAAPVTTSRQAENSPRTATQPQPPAAQPLKTENAGAPVEVQLPAESPATTKTTVPTGPAASAPGPEPAAESAATSTTPDESAARTEPEPPPPARSSAASVPPAEPVLEPPELLERSEPSYPPKSLKRAAGERIVLKLLISDKGRISRVLVERGTQFKDLEAAAVSAVLRWKYVPAMENGVAVEAWTTAEFTF